MSDDELFPFRIDPEFPPSAQEYLKIHKELHEKRKPWPRDFKVRLAVAASVVSFLVGIVVLIIAVCLYPNQDAIPMIGTVGLLFWAPLVIVGLTAAARELIEWIKEAR